jgi:hypothetical protein
MIKYRWDEPLPPAKWDRAVDRERFEKKRLEARDAPTSGIKVGKTLNTSQPVFVTPKQLSTHMQVVGSTGLGKSYFLEGIIKNLILQGHGVCLIDPHGDLYHRILEFCTYLDQIQPQRKLSRRVIPFDVAEQKQIIGFNPVQRNARIMTYQVLALMEAIRKVWGQDSFQDTPRLARWLFNAAYGVIDANLTMVQTQYLVDPKPSPYREAIAHKISNPRIRAEWEWFSSIKDRDRNEFTESSFNRLQPFVIHEIVRLMLGQQKNTLDFPAMLSGRNILLVNLAKQNTIPEDYQHLIGTLLVNEILTAAFARPRAERTPFYLIMDEFQHFVTKDMCEILDGGRKFGLHLILAHQHLHQLKEKDPEVYYSTLSNARTKVVFGGMADEDLEIMAKEFYVGELNPDEIKDEIWQTKLRPVESTRTTRSSAWGESSGEGHVSHSSLNNSDAYIRGSGTWSSPRTESYGTSEGRSDSYQSISASGGSESSVPWYEYHEYKEMSSREFRSLEEQLYKKKAQMKRQPTQHAMVLIPDKRVQQIKAATIKEHRITDGAKEEFTEACFETSGYYKTPKEADHELTALEDRLLAAPVINVVTENPKTLKPRRAKSARKTIFDKIKEPA